jgi:hypothetical protein
MPVARGIVFRHEAARYWEAEPSPVPSGEPRHCMGDAGGGRWHADEMWIPSANSPAIRPAWQARA